MPSSREYKSSKPPLSRHNNVYQSMEVERMGKVTRMNSDSAPSPPAQPRSSLTHSANSMQNGDRAMNVPALSLDIPAHTSKFILKHGEIVPEEEADSDAGSAVSSICQSPGWEQLTDTKKKKEKKEAKERKKEKEKADAKALAKAKAEAKLAEKHRHKLTKPPPANKKLSRMSLMMNRSTSAPAVPRLPAPTIPHASPMKPWEEEIERKEENRRVQNNAVPEVPVPWRTAHGTPVSTPPVESSPAHDSASARLSNDGFIGGLKFKLAEEAYVQEKIRRQSLTEDRKAAIVQKQESNFEFGLSDNRGDHHHDSDTIDTPSSTETDSVQTPHQWESIYEQAARMMRQPESMSPEVEEHHDRSSRKPRKKTYPPTSYFPAEFDDSSSVRNSSTNSNRRDTFGQNVHDECDGTGTRPASSSAFSSESPTLNTRDTSVDRGTSAERGSSALGHVGNQRAHGGEPFAITREDEVHHKPPTSRGRRLSFTGIKNFARNSSADAASTIKSYGRTTQVESAAPARTSANPRALSGEDKSIPAAESTLHERRSTSKSNVPTLQSMKHAARSAFGRATVSSPTEIDASPKVSGNPGYSHLKSGSTSSSADSSISKAERFFGQPILAGFGSPTDTHYASSGKLSTSSTQQSPDLMTDSQDRLRTGYNSRSTTDSGEEYSTHDESSNLTTPMASNAASYYDSFPQIQDDDLVFDQPNGPKIAPKHSFTMTNALPAKSHEQHSTVLKPVSREKTPQVPTIPSSKDVQTPDLLRSISTPDLQQQQDLSFLPPLRHQPLIKPVKDKRKTLDPLAVPQTQHRINPKSGSLARPEPIPLASNSVVGTSPTSPISSQYLQNARNSIHRPPPRAGPDPIAKMFVVCCQCKYFHDMPSKIYECMAKSESVVEDKNLGVSGVVSTSVRCPWCGHGMTTACCAGYAAVVVLREKLH